MGGTVILSRRALVGKLAAGAAVACAATVGPAQAISAWKSAGTPAGSGLGDEQLGLLPEAAAARADPMLETKPLAAEASATAPWELVSPLAMGSPVAQGWRVAGLTGVENGSCVLTLENRRGRAHRVHLCRNDGRPQGLVYTKQVDLVVMNGGQGDLPTDESLAQAVAEVAHVLALNEADRQQAPVMAAMLPHAERVHLFAEAARLR